jgi:hypothetical protein
MNTTLCENLAFDFCAYWGAGKIINQYGISEIYNLDLLSNIQKNIYPESCPIDPAITPVEIPYPPIFVLPFQLFSIIDLPVSFIIWTLFNLIGFIAYLCFFTKSIFKYSLPFSLITLVIISSPIFQNLRYGQVNIWLGICAGEFLRAVLSDKPVKAGLWLGGLLLKPQVLILIIPFLLIQGAFKILKGFAISSLAVFVISFLMVGKNGFLNLISILLDSAGGAATSNPGHMMNWRMLGVHLGSITSSKLGLAVIVVGSLITIGLTLLVFRKAKISDPEYSIALLGIFAATCISTWHAHIHMSIVLIPIMLYLVMSNLLDKRLFAIWILLPMIVQFFMGSIMLLGDYEIFHIEPGNLTEFAFGFRLFLANSIILIWALRTYYKKEKTGQKFKKAVY